MSRFWHNWFRLWCAAIGVFGLVLAGGAFQATTGPVEAIIGILSGGGMVVFEPPLRFSLAVMGAVSIGWAVTLWFVIDAAIELGERGRPLWKAITAGMVAWFVIDCTLSIATGFGLNVLPNIALVAMYVVGLMGSGVLKKTQ